MKYIEVSVIAPWSNPDELKRILTVSYRLWQAWGVGLHGLIRSTAQFSRLLRQARGMMTYSTPNPHGSIYEMLTQIHVSMRI